MRKYIEKEYKSSVKTSESGHLKKKYCNIEDYMKSNEFKETIERNEFQLRKSVQANSINYNLCESEPTADSYN